MEPPVLVKRKVYVKHILPFLAYDGQGLYLGQIEFVEGEYGQDGTERTFLMRQREGQTGLVGILLLAHQPGSLWT